MKIVEMLKEKTKMNYEYEITEILFNKHTYLEGKLNGSKALTRKEKDLILNALALIEELANL
ncbi:hypothetical protein EOM39_01245 [Candidatus Gracilibacteria bacterium]|nr:hypothetical protein [Candidatus Gracilibacteria bacterium]